MIELLQEQFESTAAASIKVVGIGGAGGNTVNSIVNSGYSCIDSIVANTDSQALSLSKANHVIHIGVKSAKGLGAGANPDLGQRAAQEDLDKIMDAVDNADIVFLTGGMGGGTGSGALPVVARALREKGILCIAIVTKPFVFEGKRRSTIADNAIEALRKEVDTLIVIPNQKLLDVVDQQVSMIDAFAMINEILSKSVKGISDIITKPGHINVDFADVRTIMKDMGLAVMGTGVAIGKDRAQQAALQAISSPLLENMSIKGARGVLLNITGGKNLGLHEISQAASVIYDQAHEDATIILGSVIDEDMGDEVSVTIIATGFAVPSASQAVDVKLSAVQAESKIIGSVLDMSSTPAQKETVAHKAVIEPVSEPTQEIQADSSSCKTYPEDAHELAASKKDEPKAAGIKDAVEFLSQENEIDMNDLDVPAFLRKDARVEK
ncbi:MAG: cell division protein FtsZ [Candidatus Babeliales bacterium]|nr:cell division protein FtsZ [Candidatus Babeliales bacterium]